MNGGRYAEGLYQFDMRSDNALRGSNVANPSLNDPMGPRNRVLTTITSLLMGHTAFDYSNPAAMAPIQFGSQLRPSYARYGDSIANIRANIGKTNAIWT